MLENIIRTAEQNRVVNEEDYIGEDGLLHCGVCGGKKQTVITYAGEQRTVCCVCKCVSDRLGQDQLRQRTQGRRKECFSSQRFFECVFSADTEPQTEASVIAKNYAESFDVSASGWLIFTGDTGTGKTFRAAAICNRVIDNGFTALMTSLSQIERELWNTRDKQTVYDRLTRTQLLVLDDFGCERKSDYMNEIKYNVICDRYDKGLPLVMTTNLAPAQFRSDDMGDKRFFSRIFERGIFVPVKGTDKRREKLLGTMKAQREKLLDVRDKR